MLSVCVHLLLLVIILQHAYSAPCKNCSCFINAGAAFCSGGNLTEIPRQLEDKTLRVIDLSDNNIVAMTNSYVLAESRAGLHQLTLRNNMIDEFPPELLKGMVTLNEFDISWNRVGGAITPMHFTDTKKLDYLSLAHNQITCIQNHTFGSLSMLTEIDLSYNQLTSKCLSRDTICELENLIVLRLSNNNVGSLFSGTWISGSQKVGFLSCLKWITNIQASNCGIQTISRHSFRNLDYLTNLDLSNNYLRSWKADTLLSNSLLVYLDLGNNYLRHLPPDFVKGCSKLSHLSLRNNELRIVDYRWLSKKQDEDVTFNLDSSIRAVRNFLKQDHQDRHVTSLLPSSGARESMWVDWSGNPWLCSCRMLPFVAWILESGLWFADVDGYHDVVCYDPAQHRGNALLDLYITGMVDVVTARMLAEECVLSLPTEATIDVGATNATITAPNASFGPTSAVQDAKSLYTRFSATTYNPRAQSGSSFIDDTKSKIGSTATTQATTLIVSEFDHATMTNRIYVNRPNTTSLILKMMSAALLYPDETSKPTLYPLTSLKSQDNTYARHTTSPEWIFNVTSIQPTVLSGTVSNKSSINNNTLYRVNEQNEQDNSHVAVIVLCVVADIVLSIGLFLLVRKWCTRKTEPRRWATVVPLSSLPSNSSTTSDVVLTPVQT